MNAPLSIRLDDEVRGTLAKEAEAKRLRIARIRAGSEAVAKHYATSAEAREFFDDWGDASGFGHLGD